VEPLIVKLWDHDTLGHDDPIGQVVIDLSPLLLPASPGVIAGWFPVYDTLRGNRGEVRLSVRLKLIRDLNKFRESSCDVRFFAGLVSAAAAAAACDDAGIFSNNKLLTQMNRQGLPVGYSVTALHGFVEELFVRDDPEFQWIDKIRAPRASNEARQVHSFSYVFPYASSPMFSF
jgi:hypothetical protein